MSDIKFGTDGWRAIIAEDFTTENVARVSESVANWLLSQYKEPSVVLGYDCRFGGKLFADTVAKVFTYKKIKVLMGKGIVSTPMISLGTVQNKATLGVIITASHNPPSYNGFKLKASYGGPLDQSFVQEIEDGIPRHCGIAYKSIVLTEAEESLYLNYLDFEGAYLKQVESNFDLAAIKKSGLKFVYDSMYGAGQNAMFRLFPEIIHFHRDDNPGFHGQAPEPIHKNLLEVSTFIRENGKIDCGLCTDGDADRIGLYDDRGNFVDSHHLILLLIHYLVKYKGMKGKVCVAFSTTVKIRMMCQHYGLELEVVKIGFKYICGIMVKEDVLLGGEESGGIALKGHIPERDGIWMGLTIWEFMTKTGKSISQLIDEVYEITGGFYFDRQDLQITETQKQKILKRCHAGELKTFGAMEVIRTENLDGFKFFFSESSWLMIRASGTEPVLRLYAEGRDKNETDTILDQAKSTLFD